MTHPLVDELLTLMGKPGDVQQHFEQWRERCEAALDEMTEADARAFLETLQPLLQENRALFERESKTLLATLVKGHDNPKRKAAAKQYTDTGKL
jgi:hypothetical protein